MKTVVASLVLALALAASVRAEEAIEIKLKYTPKAGDKLAHQKTDKTEMKMEVTAGGNPVQDVDQKDEKGFEYVEDVVKVEGSNVVEGKYTFSKATHLVEGEEEDYDFSEKTVSAKKGKDGWEFFNADGTNMSEEDAAAVADALDHKSDKKEGAPEIEEVLAPKKPVKVGESWDIDPKEFASGFAGDDLESFDLEKSKGSMKLTSAEKRNGVQCGKIEGEITMVALKLGALALGKPLKFKFKIAYDGCVDGTQPMGTVTLKAGIKGKSTADANGTEVDLDINMDMNMEMSFKRAK